MILSSISDNALKAESLQRRLTPFIVLSHIESGESKNFKFVPVRLTNNVTPSGMAPIGWMETKPHKK